ncbi:MAG: elongation factor G [Gemmatimonadetes bacterium]|nr:MAG: elongation factor G [Gemmatimonadota bacterium]
MNLNQVKTDDLRNVAIVGHGNCGKTTLVESMLHLAGMSDRFGSVDNGTTVSDYDPYEIEKKQSINLTPCYAVWQDKKINILDTPGYPDYLGEVVAAIRAVEAAVIVIDAESGVEVVTEKVWQYAEEDQLPKFVFVNKIDKENAKFDEAIESIKHDLEKEVVPLQVPIGEGKNFKGFVDLLNLKAYTIDDPASGNPATEMDEIPAEAQELVAKYRDKLLDSIAETDEELMMKYLEGEDMSEEEIIKGLHDGISDCSIVPALVGSASNNRGVKSLLNAIVKYFPHPQDHHAIKAKKEGSDDEVKIHADPTAPVVLQIFKMLSQQHVGELAFFRVFSGTLETGTDLVNTFNNETERINQIGIMNGKKRTDVKKLVAGDIGAFLKLKNSHTGDTLCDKSSPVVLPEIPFPKPVINSAIELESKGDEDKLGEGLAKLSQEDPTFVWKYDSNIKQTIISGMGEGHLDIMMKRLKDRYNLQVKMVEPRIPYRETIRRKVEVQGKYKKQSGGRGQYGDAWIRFEPQPRGAGFEFVDAIVGGVIPGKFLPAVEKGIIGAMQEGVIAGYPVVDIKATAYDGSHHPVDSSENAFKMAGSLALKKAMTEGGADPVILEPIYNVEIIIPEEYLGDVMGDVSSRRGRVQGMEAKGRKQIVKAQIPLAELYKYSTVLRSMTQGRGMHTREFSHYEEAPRDVQKKLMEEYQKARAEGH